MCDAEPPSFPCHELLSTVTPLCFSTKLLSSCMALISAPCSGCMTPCSQPCDASVLEVIFGTDIHDDVDSDTKPDHAGLRALLAS